VAYYIITGGCPSARSPKTQPRRMRPGDRGYLLDQIYHIITYKYYCGKPEILEGYGTKEEIMPSQSKQHFFDCGAVGRPTEGL